MKLEDMIKYVITSVKREPMRTWLTIIGIVIGSFALLSVISFSDFTKNTVMKDLSQFGADNIVVMPFTMPKSLSSFATGPSKMGRLYTRDVKLIESIHGVRKVEGIAYGKATVVFKDKAITSLISGGGPGIFDIWSDYFSFGSGRPFRTGEHNVVVLGYDAANTLFGRNKIHVGNYVQINGRSFRVVGILNKIGSTFSKMDDSAIYIPTSDAREVLKGYVRDNELGGIIISIYEGYNPDDIKSQIESALDVSHRTNEKERDYTVITEKFMTSMIGSILGAVNFFITVILVITAGISAFGIANTMYTSVAEKEKEIGILKAIGATKRLIQEIFLTESMLMAMIGGMIGVILVAILILAIDIKLGLNIPVSIVGIIEVLLFSAFVGAIAGYYPSKEASEINPIKAINE